MPDVPFGLPCSDDSSRGMWFKLISDSPGELTVTTCSPDTNFPHVVSVHKNTPSLPVIGCSTVYDEECPSGYGASVAWIADANAEYLIRVAGMDGTIGNFRLDFTDTPDATPNNKCDAAQTVDIGTWSFNTSGAQGDNPILCDGEVVSNRSAWFQYTANESGIVSATTCPDDGGYSKGESSVTMYYGCNEMSSACDNLLCDGVHGGAQLQVATGDSVFIRVAPPQGGLANDFVKGNLVVDFKTNCVGDLNGDLEVNIEDLLILIDAWGTCEGCSSDFNGDGLVAIDDLLVLINAWGTCE